MSPVAGVLRRARIAASVVYAIQGVGFAAVLTSIPTYQRRLDLGDDVVTLVILGVCVCAGAGSALSGTTAPRVGSRRVVTGGLLLAAVAIAGVGVARTWPGFFVTIAAYGMALGIVDAGMNMQGIDVERRYGRSLLASFFAANAAGGVAGALLISGAAALDASFVATFALVAGIVAVGAATVRPRLLGAAPSGLPPGGLGDGGRVAVPGGFGAEVPVAVEWPAGVGMSAIAPAEFSAAHGAALRRRIGVAAGTVAVLGVAMLAFPVADSAVSAWSASFLRNVLGAGAVVAPWGYAAYQATLILTRLLADRAVRRHGRVRIARLGGSVGALGFLAVAAAPALPWPAGGAGSPWPVAVLGFAATGLGIGVIAPLAFSAAGDRARESVAAARRAGYPGGPLDVAAATDWAVARLNVFTYAGAVLGGVLTGIFATADEFAWGFVALAGLAAVSVLVAPVLRESRGDGERRAPAAAPAGAAAADVGADAAARRRRRATR